MESVISLGFVAGVALAALIMQSFTVARLVRVNGDLTRMLASRNMGEYADVKAREVQMESASDRAAREREIASEVERRTREEMEMLAERSPYGNAD